MKGRRRGDGTPYFKNPGLAWHPLRVMSRDEDLSPLFHSVFAMERIRADHPVDETGGARPGGPLVRVVLRVPDPRSRKDVKDLEENLMLQFCKLI